MLDVVVVVLVDIVVGDREVSPVASWGVPDAITVASDCVVRDCALEISQIEAAIFISRPGYAIVNDHIPADGSCRHDGATGKVYSRASIFGHGVTGYRTDIGSSTAVDVNAIGILSYHIIPDSAESDDSLAVVTYCITRHLRCSEGVTIDPCTAVVFDEVICDYRTGVGPATSDSCDIRDYCRITDGGRSSGHVDPGLGVLYSCVVQE